MPSRRLAELGATYKRSFGQRARQRRRLLPQLKRWRRKSLVWTSKWLTPKRTEQRWPWLVSSWPSRKLSRRSCSSLWRRRWCSWRNGQLRKQRLGQQRSRRCGSCVGTWRTAPRPTGRPGRGSVYSARSARRGRRRAHGCRRGRSCWHRKWPRPRRTQRPRVTPRKRRSKQRRACPGRPRSWPRRRWGSWAGSRTRRTRWTRVAARRSCGRRRWPRVSRRRPGSAGRSSCWSRRWNGRGKGCRGWRPR
mmetsp:Transcript_78287/g.209276  ORF Transcript_78287/g.209276 Transcript_78287/m.209276 type:complete len:248 (+) Transcript_78287:404-1147(+)